MTSKRTTFSRQVKDELSALACDSRCCRRAEVAAAFFGSGQMAGNAVTLSTAHGASASRFSALVSELYREVPLWQAGRELVSLTVRTPDALQALRSDLVDLFGYDAASGKGGQLNCEAPCCRQAILRALYLSCGSISEPASGYHLELALRRMEAARMTVALLGEQDIRAGIVARHGHDVVYLKEGQYIADFLLLTGAHRSLLSFESLRVEKEMRNSVNRMVNCDSANTQRIADTAARQTDLIRLLSEWGGLPALPAELRAAAEARLENPELSLKELGEIMQPPLGKSGMNHRLRKLEQAAADYLKRKGVSGHGS